MKLILVGYGKMGQAMLDGWLKDDLLTACLIVDPFAHTTPDHTTHLKDIKDINEAPEETKADIIIFAVKPQVMDKIVPLYRDFISEHTLFVSIAAGKTLSALETYLAPTAKIIRAMPNTPAAIKQGVTVACGNSHVTEAEKNTALTLLKAVGDALWMDDEGHMNAVTAVSGSGPAYIFLLIEAMAQAGITAGLPEEIATKLARQTVIGSAALAEDAADLSAATLRENVTSPGGTTAAALDVLMHTENGLENLMTQAIQAAKIRGEELE